MKPEDMPEKRITTVIRYHLTDRRQLEEETQTAFSDPADTQFVEGCIMLGAQHAAETIENGGYPEPENWPEGAEPPFPKGSVQVWQGVEDMTKASLWVVPLPHVVSYEVFVRVEDLKPEDVSAALHNREIDELRRTADQVVSEHQRDGHERG